MEIFCSKCGEQIHEPPEDVWWVWDNEETTEAYLCDNCFNALGLSWDEKGGCAYGYYLQAG